jgi:hypothetical protein
MCLGCLCAGCVCVCARARERVCVRERESEKERELHSSARIPPGHVLLLVAPSLPGLALGYISVLAGLFSFFHGHLGFFLLTSSRYPLDDTGLFLRYYITVFTVLKASFTVTPGSFVQFAYQQPIHIRHGLLHTHLFHPALELPTPTPATLRRPHPVVGKPRIGIEKPPQGLNRPARFVPRLHDAVRVGVSGFGFRVSGFGFSVECCKGITSSRIGSGL